jgi:hypothetical protein
LTLVDGSPGFRQDSARLTDLLADCRKLRAWASERAVGLNDSPGSLATLDRALRAIGEDARLVLSNDCALYLGTAIVRPQPHAHWRVWPNGQPVVRLASGRELDVVAAIHDRAHAGQLNLVALYDDAVR